MLRFEPPDVCSIRMNGDVTGSDIRALLDIARMVAKRTDCGIYWLADLRSMGTVTSDARRAMIGDGLAERREWLRGSAAFGATFTTRVVADLMIRAIRALDPTRYRPVAVVETEAEARAFLDEHRKRDMGKSPP